MPKLSDKERQKTWLFVTKLQRGFYKSASCHFTQAPTGFKTKRVFPVSDNNPNPNPLTPKGKSSENVSKQTFCFGKRTAEK